MMDDDLGGGSGSVATNPSADPGAKTEGGGTMPPGLSLLGLAPRQQIDPSVLVRSTLSPNPGFSISR